MAPRRSVKTSRGSRRAAAAKHRAPFKLTYATMFNPPEELHQRFESALANVKAQFGRDHGMIINGADRFSQEKLEDRSPINTDWLLGTFQKGTVREVQEALAAARNAFPGWSRRSEVATTTPPSPTSAAGMPTFASAGATSRPI